MANETISSMSAGGDNEQIMTLAELGNLDATEIKELRFELFPKAVGMWQIIGGNIELINDKPCMWFDVKPVKIDNVVGEPGEQAPNPQELLEKVHRESFFPRKPEDVGRWKAWIIDAGATWQGKASVPDLHSAIAKSGMTFPGKIAHQQDKHDKDKKYARLQPVPMSKRTQAAQAPAA